MNPDNEQWSRNIISTPLDANTKILFFRHLKKEYKNTNERLYGCDPLLKELTKEELFRDELFIKNLLFSNFPDIIICSPFSRTRETALFIRDTIEKLTGKHVVIYVENNFGEYLGNQNSNLTINSFYPETYQYNPIVEKDFFGFRRRCKEAFNDFKNFIEKYKFKKICRH